MKIAIMAMGSRGDVQPYLALGKGLKAAGHFVRLITHQNFERLVTSHGLEFYPVKGDVQAVVESPEMLKLLEQGNFLAINAHTAKLVQDAAIDWAQDGIAACRGIDLLVAGVGGLYLSIALTQKLNIRFLQAYIFPFTPTTAFPAIVLPQSFPDLAVLSIGYPIIYSAR